MTGTPCDDGDACSKNTICSNGACVGGQPIDCADADPCTIDSCSGDGHCQNVPDPFCCTPECEGKVCGPNGCGGTCGDCPEGTACGDAGLCEVSCTADCGGKICGSDGCGGSCGACPGGTTCNGAGTCTNEGLLYWYPLQFAPNGTLLDLVWKDEVSFEMADARISPK